MLRSIPRVEQTPSDTDKRIVKLGLEESVSVAVNLVDSGMVRNGDVIRRDSDKLAVLLVLVMHDLVSVAPSCLSCQPQLGERGGEWAGVLAEAVGVENEWDQD